MRTLSTLARDGVPTFRFHGRTPPKAGQRVPILNAAPEAAVNDDGVAQLRLYDPIDSWGGDWGVSAIEFADALGKLPAGVNTIELRVNSPGGEVFDAIAIMNLLRSYDADVRVVVDGVAASAASFIAASADETIAGPNSEMMIHDALGMALGNAGDMQKMADVLNHLSDNIASVYAAKTGGDVKAWRKAMLNETWYSAEEAVTAGLADTLGVAGTAPREDDPDEQDDTENDEQDDGEQDQATAARFDLAALFEHSGRSDAPAPLIPAAHASENSDGGDSLARRHRHNARRYAHTA